MRYAVGDRVQRIWSGPPTVWRITGVIKVPPPRWEPDGTVQISYEVITDVPYYKTCAVVPESELKRVK